MSCDDERKKKRALVRRELKQLHPALAAALKRAGMTPDAIADHVRWRGDERMGAFDRILHDDRSLWRTFALADVGERRRSGRYVHLYYVDHAVRIDAACSFADLSPRIFNPPNAGTRKHLAKMLHVVQSIANDDAVGAFMVGKASVQQSKKVHAHSAMVHRFGDKYKLRGYTHMAGLCVLSGAAAESGVLQMEALFHTLLAPHAQYHRALSNAQSGALSKSPATACVTLYVAFEVLPAS